ncbi:putative Rab-GTPase-TBC domain-containing protein [Helianthus annuus]|nr:putative Rab-GTPase-TBC domain-containing protein [Helianthus annuus]KAJ0638750.1 putative Rab-GTPase-TBC domain-containing protein [Helianthus annuus]KAJ0906565.1 putative Rab-GTPase-TBC domain-containing protein [Helianthus annuus]
MTLLLTQEFSFADILRIWDTLLSDPEGPQETLLRVCCAMLILVRKRLLASDFTANLKLLQSYPSTNISHLLYSINVLVFLMLLLCDPQRVNSLPASNIVLFHSTFKFNNLYMIRLTIHSWEFKMICGYNLQLEVICFFYK